MEHGRVGDRPCRGARATSLRRLVRWPKLDGSDVQWCSVAWAKRRSGRR